MNPEKMTFDQFREWVQDSTHGWTAEPGNGCILIKPMLGVIDREGRDQVMRRFERIGRVSDLGSTTDLSPFSVGTQLCPQPRMKTVDCPTCGGSGQVPDQVAIGAEMRELREAMGLSVREIARQFGLSAGFAS